VEKQQNKKQWAASKYDILGRVIFTGTTYVDSTKTVQSLNTDYNSLLITESYTNGTGYTCNNFCDADTLTVNYYDSYDFISLLPTAADKNTLPFVSLDGYDGQHSTAKGLLTGTRIYHLDNPSLYETTALYYDKYGHVVQTRSSNHLDGYDLVYNALDFTGKPTKTLKTHNIAGQASITELYTYTYDKAQRPRVTTYQLNGGAVITQEDNTYDDLGRLIAKARHSNADAESHTYNVRSWPTNNTSGSFQENLYYNSSLPSGVTPSYNGNIAMNTWTYNGAVKKYGYAYDGLNRLTTSTLYDVNNQSSTTFAETFTFDKMGNVTNLGRTGSSTQIDGLTLTYNGNQLKQVDDANGSRDLYDIKEYTNRNTSGDDFAYDANGNMVKDLDRNIVAFQYNVLNLPDIIQFKNGNQIKNTYDAGGQKLGTEYFTQLTNITPLADGQIISQSYNSGVVDQTGNAYIGNMEYKTQNGNSSLTAISRIYNDEGYVENPANPQYYYYRRDHLGDNREVWLANTGETVQRTQYYPSGLPWAYNSGDNPGKQQRKYNGKEFVEMHGYDTYDIVWRQYYPAIMRFQTMDPEIEDAYAESPYSMCDNNMVLRTDPDGRFWNYIIGAAIGAGIDYASQVAVNLVEGKGIKESLTHVDGKSILVSAVAGATGVGLASIAEKATTIYKLGKVSTSIVKTVSGIASDAVVSAGSQYAKNGSVSGKNVVMDAVAGQVGRGLGSSAKSKMLSSERGVSLVKQANRTAGKAMHNSNVLKIARAEEAAANVVKYGSKTETAVSSATSNTISSINENAQKIKKEKSN